MAYIYHIFSTIQATFRVGGGARLLVGASSSGNENDVRSLVTCCSVLSTSHMSRGKEAHRSLEPPLVLFFLFSLYLPHNFHIHNRKKKKPKRVDERWLLLACLMAVILFFFFRGPLSQILHPLFLLLFSLFHTSCRWPELRPLRVAPNSYKNREINKRKERERKKDKHTHSHKEKQKKKKEREKRRKERRLHFGPRLFLNECR